MKTAWCPVCEKEVGYARRLGVGTVIAIVLTFGLWLLALPLYPKRCTICGHELPKFYRLRQDVPKSPDPSEAPPSQVPPVFSAAAAAAEKICPACAETIKLAALKCRFCGHQFDPGQVAREVADFDKSSHLAAGRRQCPHCGSWGVTQAYLPDGGLGPWCPSCRRPATP